jgi:hypothetical protein
MIYDWLKNEEQVDHGRSSRKINLNLSSFDIIDWQGGNPVESKINLTKKRNGKMWRTLPQVW